MNYTEARSVALGMRDRIRTQYLSYGKFVAVRVENKKGKPTVVVRIVKPTKKVSQLSYKDSGINVLIVLE